MIAGGNWGFPVGTWGIFFENLEGHMEVRVLDSGSHAAAVCVMTKRPRGKNHSIT